METGAPVDRKTILSSLWIFYMFNQAYGDITTLYYSVFINRTPTVTYTNAFLLAGVLLVEPAIVMIVLSRVLNYRLNRWANIVVAAVLTVVSAATLFVATPTPVYAFIAAASIVTGLLVIWSAWTWSDPSVVRGSPKPS